MALFEYLDTWHGNRTANQLDRPSTISFTSLTFKPSEVSNYFTLQALHLASIGVTLLHRCLKESRESRSTSLNGSVAQVLLLGCASADSGDIIKKVGRAELVPTDGSVEQLAVGRDRQLRVCCLHGLM